MLEKSNLKMKSPTDNQTAVQDRKLENNMLIEFSGNTTESPIVTSSEAGNTDPFKNDMPELSTETSVTSSIELISAFGNLDLNDTKVSSSVLYSDQLTAKARSKEDLKPQHFSTSVCVQDKNKSNEDAVIKCGGLAEDADIKSKCSMAVYATNSSLVSECVEPPRITEAVSREETANRTYENDLVACFSEIFLNEKPSCKTLSSGTDKSSLENLSHSTVCEAATSLLENNLPLKTENGFYSEKEIYECLGDTDHDQSDEGSLIERGAKKIATDHVKEPKKLGTTMKVSKTDCARYLKHLSGGSFISTSTNKPFTETHDFHPVNKSSVESSHFQNLNPQASLPLYFDQNEIYPVKQDILGCRYGDAYSFTTSPYSGDLLSDPLSCSTTFSCGDSNICSPLLAKSTMFLGPSIQQNADGRQSMSTSDSLLDLCYSPTASEISCYNQQGSRSTSPESGYGGSPIFSDYIDDGTELFKYNQLSSPDSSVCSDTSACLVPVQSRDESIDNTDLSLIDEDCSLSEPQSTELTEEDRQRISMIMQDLKKCEEYVKPNEAMGDVHPTRLDSQNTFQDVLCDANVSPLHECSMREMPSAPKNVPLQQECAQITSPQVIVICVPYAVQGGNQLQKNLKPILPKPTSQPIQSSRKRLLQTLDSTKVQTHLFRLYEKHNNNNKNVIYIENNETRQTNLHIAVIKQQVELAYCILEIHKQYNKKNMSAVNSRDIHKRTALHYAISNVMTAFVDYLKDMGAK